MSSKGGKGAFVIIVAFAGIITALLFLPPIFNSFFSMSDGLNQNNIILYSLNVFLILIGISLLVLNFSYRTEFALVFLILLFPLWSEMAARLYITQFKPDQKENYLRLAQMTNPETQRFKAHPFLHYTGNPLRRGKVLQGEVTYNKYGFRGPDWTYEKPDSVIRIACLGGSTTHSGYPQELEKSLNELSLNSNIFFEVMNFGIDGYTTAHSLINYSLNVRHFNPDYVILHHGWNEVNIRGSKTDFYYDYSHAYKVYDSPFIYDAILWRGSVIYRYLMIKFKTQPDWLDLLNLTRKPWEDNLDRDYSNLDELSPFRSNIELIISQSLDDKCKVILTTMPRSFDSNKKYYLSAQNINQCNDICREIHKNYGNPLIFADLDFMYSGTPEIEQHFLDVAHLDSAGRKLKAEKLAEIILEDFK